MPKVRVSDSAHKEIDLLRGNKTQKEFIDTLIKTYKQYDVIKKEKHQLKLEVAKLRSEKAAEVSIHQKTAHKSLREPKLPLPQPPQNPLELDCIYLAYNPEKGKYFCDGKPIDKFVCMRRHQRWTFGKGSCFPSHLASHCRKCGREIRPQFKVCYYCKDRKNDEEEKWHSPQGNIFKGYEEGGAW